MSKKNEIKKAYLEGKFHGQYAVREANLIKRLFEDTELHEIALRTLGKEFDIYMELKRVAPSLKVTKLKTSDDCEWVKITRGH